MELAPSNTTEHEELNHAIGQVLLGATGTYHTAEDGQPPYWDPETLYSQSHFGNDTNQVQ